MLLRMYIFSSNSFITTQTNTGMSSMLPQCSNILQIIPTPQYTTTLTPHVVYSSQFTPQFATAVQSSTNLVNTQDPYIVADESSNTEEDVSLIFVYLFILESCCCYFSSVHYKSNPIISTEMSNIHRIRYS